MDVRCERCRVSYAVLDARIPEAGVKVACPGCGHGFLLRKKVLAVAVPLKTGDGDPTIPITDLASPDGAVRVTGEGPDRAEWRLRQASGAVFPFRELSTLQRWIVERKASRDDEVAMAGQDGTWRRLGDVPELASFFGLVDQAGRASGPRPEPSPPGSRGSPGMEDPAWAQEPGAPPKRITRSQAAPAPRPRRRVVWVALLVLGLLGVAAGTVYLRRKAEIDVVPEAIVPPPAKPAVAVPVEVRPPAPRPAEGKPPEPKPAEAAPVETAGQPDPAPAAAEASPAPAGTPVEAVVAAAARPPVRPSPRDEATTALRTALAQAREQRDRGRSEEALDLYGRALAIDGRNATALAGRGACYLDLSRYAQAEAAFEGALETDPRNAEALFGLAETYRYMGRKADAVAGYERFLVVRPNGDDAAAARRIISQSRE
ncbi:MAG: hypothetical protein RJA59_44 [Pseudomonadota bacterium]